MLTITPKILLEIASHEGIVCEAYKDSVGIWTWSVGVTDASGHLVHPRYVDSPQPVERCLEVFGWLLRERYLPPVAATFAGHDLTEEELGAALSFHYNTGAIGRASWPTKWKAGEVEAARRSFMEWRRPSEILERRKKECTLFFDHRWSAEDGRVPVYPVRKPSYQPDFRRAERVDIREALARLGAAMPA